MSLVINANSQGDGGFTLSNQFLGMSPDFQNALLFFLDGCNVYTFNAGINSGNYVASINGTRINHWTAEVVAPNYYIGLDNNEGGPCSLGIYNQSTSGRTITKRYAINKRLNGGEIIGKIMEFPLAKMTMFYSPNGYVISPRSGSNIIYEIELLHQDGTITSVGTMTHTFGDNTNTSNYIGTFSGLLDDSTGTNFQFSKGGTFAGTEQLTTSGFVAQAGDYVCLKITLKVVGSNNDTTANLGIGFGYKYTSNDFNRYRPIQVSID